MTGLSAANAHDCGRSQYLQADRHLSWGLDVSNMLSSAVVYTSDGERDVQNEHDLLLVSFMHRSSVVTHILPRQLLQSHRPIQMLSVCTNDSTSALKQILLSEPEIARKQR